MKRLNKKGLTNALEALGVEAPKGATNLELEKLLAKTEKANAKLERTEPAPEETPETPETPEEAGEETETEDEAKLEAPKAELPQEEVDGDYLRQYQYRKGAKFGSPESDPQPGSRAAIMKAHLLKQDKVSIIVHRPEGESEEILASVNLNGYRLDLPKEAYIALPLQVAQIITEAQAQTAAAIQRNQTTGGEEALS